MPCLIGTDPAYFGIGFRPGIVISFAASFGVVTRRDMVPKDFQEALVGFKEISVRDQNSAALIQEITGRCLRLF